MDFSIHYPAFGLYPGLAELVFMVRIMKGGKVFQTKEIKAVIPAYKIYSGRWKEIKANEVALTLYSLDGRTWSTNKQELEALKEKNVETE